MNDDEQDCMCNMGAHFEYRGTTLEAVGSISPATIEGVFMCDRPTANRHLHGILKLNPCFYSLRFPFCLFSLLDLSLIHI